MNKKKVKVVTCIMLATLSMSSSLFAASPIKDVKIIYSPRFSIKPTFNIGEGELATSSKFSIKPYFNTGEGLLAISSRFSIKPALNTGKTKYFYSGIFSAIDLPDAEFFVDGKPLTDPTAKVKEKSEVKLKMDFTTYDNIKDEVDTVEYFYEDITDGIKHPLTGATYNNYIVYESLNIKLEGGKVYRVGQVTTLKGGMKYETVSVEFKVTETGLIVFLSPEGDMFYEEYVTTVFDISNKLQINTADIFLEEIGTGKRVLVGQNVDLSTTKIQDMADGTRHEFRYKLPKDLKRYKHVIVKIN